MVKHFNQQLRREQICQEEKLLAKAQYLAILRRKDLVKDTKRNYLKRGLPYTKPKLNVVEYIVATNNSKLPKDADDTAKQLYNYKVALANSQTVLKQFAEMNIKNDRPPDYLVQMYKSDKQMFKVRRYLTEKEEELKQKMQGKDWESKNKKRERAKKISEAKRAHKKDRVNAKKSFKPKAKTTKVNGKRKIKKAAAK